MESIGARLKKVRLAKGLSLEDVYKKTHIHLNIIKAIEEDSILNIGPIYIRGFLKNYCQFLGEDPAQYITDYKESQAPVLSGARRKDRNPSLLKDASLNMASLLKPRLKVKVFAAIIVGIAAVILLFNLARALVINIAILLHQRRPAVTLVAPAPKHQEQSLPSRAKPALAMPILKDRQVRLPVTAASGVKLTIYAKDSCAIEVKTDGKVMFKGRLKKGRSESWSAKEKIELSLSNAGAVDLQVNSKHISSLGVKGQALKNILITRDSLITPR